VKSQGIPTVVAFRDGAPVSMFIGAYPEQEVNAFIDQLLPTEAELVAEEAEAEEESGDLEAAEQGYRDALEKDPTNRDAGIGLGRILAERGDLAEARTVVTPFLPDPDAERVIATVRVKEWSDLDEVGTLASAKRLAAAGHWREALDAMLGSLMDDRDEATASMRDVFAVLGDDDPLVTEFRRRLSNALF
jgi:putative thioredoxin